MIFKRKLLIYITLLSLIISIFISTLSFALDQSNIYVWSDLSSSVSTSILPSKEEQQQEDRKLFRNYIRKCNFNGTKNWSSFI